MTDSSDNFKAIGMPIMLIVTFVLALAITHKSFLRAFRQSSGNIGYFLMFAGCVLSSIASMFLYFSAAWAYGMMCTVVSYMFALIVASPDLKNHAKTMFYVVGVWFALLTGIPSQLSNGVISATSKTQCDNFYNTRRKQIVRVGAADDLNAYRRVCEASTERLLLAKF